MRKVILFIAASLDNYIARKDGSVDWLFADGDYGFTEFYAGIDTIVTGRKTYDKSKEYGGDPYKGKRLIVFTRSEKLNDENKTEFVNDDIVEFMRKLKNEDGKNIWLLGGGEITKEFLLNDLIDEIVVAIHPVILGEGIPLFYSIPKQTNLELTDHKIFKNGLVELFYSVKH